MAGGPLGRGGRAVRQGPPAALRIGDEVDAATGTHNIAEVLSDQGRLDEARTLFEESLRVWRAAEFGIGVAYATSSLGRVASRSGDFDRAAELYDAAREQFRRWFRSRSWSTPTPGSPRRWCSRAAAEDAIELTSARAGADGGPRWRHAGPDAAPHPRLRAGPARRSGRRRRRADAPASRPAASRNARYEVALTLDAIARVAEAGGRRDAPARAEADELFAALGVVFVPTVPLDRLAVTAAG